MYKAFTKKHLPGLPHTQTALANSKGMPEIIVPDNILLNGLLNCRLRGSIILQIHRQTDVADRYSDK